MNCKHCISRLLDCLGASNTCTGYDYIIYGMLLIMDDARRINLITKSLYVDIALFYDTSWNCVEKNIRSVVSSIWVSGNEELLEIIFKKSQKKQKPTNKQFFRCLYEYISALYSGISEQYDFPLTCPISKQYCKWLDEFYKNIGISDRSCKKTDPHAPDRS
ncbi:sporulation initiation factor Spo0A C-terminal domain-containing protein [Faecalicatena acetigenes]|uniref:Sporulation initiation factor Spo0A C-terminal domain-containing protein n=1 Tax=Faecalicatena acetigenes TaxID=2981790 RepID=A0ABT2TC26_9FIRM|nr:MULTISPECIES: sporulation initiation factor Spo0A C-terminal domain-containing protein [Lachnospiraceae]MCU6747787.1 sporulation initiation factor Spo0A C-terminal domain-containing protein [Faecalicatena acetigenes]